MSAAQAQIYYLVHEGMIGSPKNTDTDELIIGR